MLTAVPEIIMAALKLFQMFLKHQSQPLDLILGYK